MRKSRLLELAGLHEDSSGSLLSEGMEPDGDSYCESDEAETEETVAEADDKEDEAESDSDDKLDESRIRTMIRTELAAMLKEMDEAQSEGNALDSSWMIDQSNKARVSGGSNRSQSGQITRGFLGVGFR